MLQDRKYRFFQQTNNKNMVHFEFSVTKLGLLSHYVVLLMLKKAEICGDYLQGVQKTQNFKKALGSWPNESGELRLFEPRWQDFLEFRAFD